METMQEILSWGAIQKIWENTYSPLWKMESSLRDHQQSEEAHSNLKKLIPRSATERTKG